MSVSKRLFGEENGKSVYEYTLKNGKGIEISCLNYGCAITKMITPDRKGIYENIVLGFEDLATYKKNTIFAGIVVGRVAGRIKDAQFELEGKTYILDSNDGKNHLHGGWKGFQNVVWDVDMVDNEQEAIVIFSYTSLDGENGYPGMLKMKVTYTLNNKDQFIVQYHGQSDKTTLLNPTNHTYFNLSGNLKYDIAEHILKMDSSRFLELTEEFIPTGKLLDVNDTVFDFRTGRKIIDGLISEDLRNIMVGKGYDHPYILDSSNNSEIVLYDEKSGRSLIIETDAVGVVLYTGNAIPDDLDLYGGKSRRYLGLCLETQALPDAIHHSHFPSCVLNKDQIFSTVTKYTFKSRKS